MTVSLDELEGKIGELLDTIQKDMFEKAKAHRDSHTHVAKNWEEFQKILDTQQGFIKAMWCGSEECESKVKEVTGVGSRCIPLEQEQVSDVCVCCGKPAKKMVYWGRAY